MIPTVFLPNALSVFLERVGAASHNMAHYYQDCNFDFALFNEKMRASLHKSARNRKRIAKSSGLRVGKIKVVPPADKDTPPAPPPSPKHLDLVGEKLAAAMDWPKMNLETFLRNFRGKVAYKMDPLQEDQEFQRELQLLHENARAGDADAAAENMFKLREWETDD